jgi:cytochrome c oxidase cbb3-type subunit 3
MAEQHDAKVLDHDYDGIRELDNLLPRWWLGLFYVTTLFAIVYLLYYHVLRVGYLQDDAYRREMNANYQRPPTHAFLVVLDKLAYHPPWYSPTYDERQRFLLGGQAPTTLVVPPVDNTPIEFAEPLVATDDLATGKRIFDANCVLCHGALGEGGIGPNLTDNYWIHGNQYADTVRTVVDGVVAQGMISWRGKLSPAQIHQVTSYIYTLRGTNPPKAKAPQGQAY